jgi:periplasmic protein CpxP/Spy
MFEIMANSGAQEQSNCIAVFPGTGQIQSDTNTVPLVTRRYNKAGARHLADTSRRDDPNRAQGTSLHFTMNYCKGIEMMAIRKRLVVGILALGLGAGSFAALAQAPGSGGPMGAPGDQGRSSERMKEHMAKRQTEMHDKLKLNANQEAAWSTYVAKMKPGERPARMSRAEIDTLPAPERMEKMLESMKVAEQRMTERLAATREFYAVLTPEQQTTFNAEFGRGRGHHWHGPDR